MVTKLTLPRCYRCRLHLQFCLCQDLRGLPTKTKVVVLMHWGEKHCVTNTGHLLSKCLSNVEIRWRGNPDRSPAKLDDLLQIPNTFVLYPSAGADILSDEFRNSLSTPATLIALDGNWGQASHMLRREQVLNQLPKVKLPIGAPSEYHLRRNQLLGNVCTFEAVTRALGQLEGKPIQITMEQVFRKMIAAHLVMRGKINAQMLKSMDMSSPISL